MASLKKPPVLLYVGTFFGEMTHGFLDPVTRHLDKVQIPELKCQLKIRDYLSEWEKVDVTADVTYCLGNCGSMAMPKPNQREGEKLELMVASQGLEFDGSRCSKSIYKNDLFSCAYEQVWI
ncbi:hypothetical protein ACJRO7_020496 [Eucalyptus globulus]|uniref:Uncharacterized protein n=1 Tax=Eucalyptus globulus TaxID=34317 RepID=A0ABD3KGX3_EUCGL